MLTPQHDLLSPHAENGINLKGELGRSVLLTLLMVVPWPLIMPLHTSEDAESSDSEDISFVSP